jgi:homoserine O-acetyltransferase/O-succinyltransferase
MANLPDPKQPEGSAPTTTPPTGVPDFTLRRSHPSTLPVTGAWQPGEPVGERRFLALPVDRPFALEGGGLLQGAVVAYETWGTLSPDGVTR